MATGYPSTIPGVAGSDSAVPVAIRCALHAAAEASRTSSSGTDPALSRRSSSMPRRRRISIRWSAPPADFLLCRSGCPSFIARNETSGCTSRMRRSDRASLVTCRIRGPRACACAETPSPGPNGIFRTSLDGVRNTVLAAPTMNFRAAVSASLGPKPIGTSIAITATSPTCPRSVSIGDSTTAFRKCPSSSMIAIQPPLVPSIPTTCIGRWYDSRLRSRQARTHRYLAHELGRLHDSASELLASRGPDVALRMWMDCFADHVAAKAGTAEALRQVNGEYAYPQCRGRMSGSVSRIAPALPSVRRRVLHRPGRQAAHGPPQAS
jgi:hypothetical protein